MEHTIRITDGGHVQFVYSDDLVELAREGSTKITRASHVEPHPTRTGWVADMRPSGGPVLGFMGEWLPISVLPLELMGLDLHYVGMLDPFETREAALLAEREWLAKEKGL